MVVRRMGGGGLRSHEDGFTLVELIIVVAILPLVIGAISLGLMSVLNLQPSVSARLAASGDAQIVTASYNRDLQSASQITTASHLSLQCGTGNQILGLQFPALAGSSTFIIVSYVVMANPSPSSTYSLTRYQCSDTNGTVGSPSASILSPNVQSGLTATITDATCWGTCPSVTAAGGWTSTVGVRSVTLSVSEASATAAGTFKYTLEVAPRTQSLSSNAVSSLVPLMLLSSSAGEISCSGNGSVNVAGQITLDSTVAGAISASGNAAVSANSIYSADTTDPATAIATGGGTVSPSSASATGPRFSDPYAFLTPPSPVGMTTYANSNYSGSAVISPGIYPNTINISNGRLTLTSGIYILQNGINVSGNASVVVQTGGPTNGVLLYLTGGSFSFSGNGTLNLSPLDSPPSPTVNLTVWQSSSDSNTVTLSGNAAGSILSGMLYAPKAIISESGNAGFSAGAILASSMSCSGNGQFNIGAG
jgi:prepilin-type N-terminal cleavage/methylation domain-containing protein